VGVLNPAYFVEKRSLNLFKVGFQQQERGANNGKRLSMFFLSFLVVFVDLDSLACKEWKSVG